MSESRIEQGKGCVETEWVVERLKVGEGLPGYPRSYGYEVVYRSTAECLQRKHEMNVTFSDMDGMMFSDTAVINDFIEHYPDWQLEWIPERWEPGLNVSDVGGVSRPGLKIIGWEPVETDQQIAEYMAYRRQHDKRFGHSI